MLSLVVIRGHGLQRSMVNCYQWQKEMIINTRYIRLHSVKFRSRLPPPTELVLHR